MRVALMVFSLLIPLAAQAAVTRPHTPAKPPLESLPKYQAALQKALSEISGSGRILVRYSGTENKVRVMVEGSNGSQIKRMAEELREILRQEIG